MKIQDRITDFRRVPAKDLRSNPRNWRTHPTAQADALRGVLAEIGFADAVIARETDHGLELLDGHLRAEVAGDGSIPCLIVDVTDAEADKILATMDPLTGMADADPDKLAELLDDLEVTSDAMKAMLDDLAQETGIQPPDFAPVSADEQGQLDERAKVTCPECGHEFDPAK